MTTFLTTTIPYVNAAPHLGHALEAVQADALARHSRSRGRSTRLLSGTDDNSLKNVLAARAEGIETRVFVDRNADRFADLAAPLGVAYDDFIRTSRDPRHRAGVEALWRACADDLYRDTYVGLYCVGCEHYLTPDELTAAGHCPEHAVAPQRLVEDNWFFRLSRYGDRLRHAIASDELRIEPAGRRNEVLAFIDAGLRDFSVSRTVERAAGWGIPVPDDPGQVIYVWWDALGNYVTSLGYGAADHPDLDRWWTGADRRVHVVGKGVLRFHAVYWPAMLASAGLPLPTDILVHDYLTVDGAKISKSAGTAMDPAPLAARYGTDALRWWLLRDVPRIGDADFTEERLRTRATEDLAGGLGNLVNRVVTMVHRFRDGFASPAGEPDADTKDLAAACAGASARIDAALDAFDFRAALAAIGDVVAAANRCVEATAPWALAKSGDAARLDRVLGALLAACRLIGAELSPFLPDAAGRITAATAGARLPAPAKVFDFDWR